MGDSFYFIVFIANEKKEKTITQMIETERKQSSKERNGKGMMKEWKKELKRSILQVEIVSLLLMLSRE